MTQAFEYDVSNYCTTVTKCLTEMTYGRILFWFMVSDDTSLTGKVGLQDLVVETLQEQAAE